MQSWAASRQLDIIVDALDVPSTLEISRLDFVISDVALKRNNGTWLESRAWTGFFSLTGASRSAVLTGVPAETFTALRFSVGVPKAANHADPNLLEPGHALHPANGLHWGWAGGYVFMALEGSLEGEAFSYHLGNDWNLVTVELPLEFDAGNTATLRLGIAAAKLLNGIDLAKDGNATHSREGDALAAKLKSNVAKAFSVVSTSSDRFQAMPVALSKPLSKAAGQAFPLHLSARLPKVALPADNLPTVAGVALGERLFHDPRLSRDSSLSCASCHDQRAAFSDTKALSSGVGGALGKRNAMPLFNLPWQTAFFWDGRATSLREQALMPIQDAHEMAETLPQVVTKLSADASYAVAFEQAFGHRDINAARVGLALEQYLITLVSQDSKFDRAARGETKLTAQEAHGLQLFITESDPARGLRGADCFHCHGGNLFTNGQFMNNGLALLNNDQGRAGITHQPHDQLKFKVPSLRNVAVTAPYMHDGRFTTLEEVIEHYDHGVQRSATLDANLAKHPTSGLGLTAEEKAALVAFLRVLTDERFVSPTHAPAGLAER